MRMIKYSIGLKTLLTIVGIVNRKLEVPIWNFKMMKNDDVITNEDLDAFSDKE